MTTDETPVAPPIGSTNEQASIPPEPTFPPILFPCLTADLVTTLVHTPESVRFFFSRVEPEMFGRGGQRLNPILQVSMPLSGFANMALFFNSQLEVMIKSYPHIEPIVKAMREQMAAQAAQTAQQDAAKSKK